ncbi:MAG TPA: S26 family signal peptidase [Nitriliruptorales bacterium]|nr:S26 family signal peptidase [Nitriliruptorales bacterium]
MAAWLVLFALNRSARRVQGDSMRPTLAPGQVVLTMPARPRRLRRGEVVVVRDPRDPARETVKRVAALAGELSDLPEGPGLVPAGHVAVVGDARARSTDSRHYGALPVTLVVARVVARLTPPGRRPAR